MSKQLFRQKSMERITSPEQMDDYIRVSNPSVWMILAAVIVLLVGVCVWGIFGQLDTTLQTGGVCADGQLILYVGERTTASSDRERWCRSAGRSLRPQRFPKPRSGWTKASTPI